MAYTRINWEDAPSEKTPISAENLNVMDEGIENLDKGKLDNTGDASETIAKFTEASELEKLTSGLSLRTLLGRIAKAISNLISHLADSTAHVTSTERTTWNNKADSGHKHTKSEITDFPTSMPPSAHTHNVIKSEDGVYDAVMQDDGNLVVYNKSTGESVFDTNSTSKVGHSQAASTITAGTFAGDVAAKASTSYTTAKIANAVVLPKASDPGEGGSTSYPAGTIVFVRKN